MESKTQTNRISTAENNEEDDMLILEGIHQYAYEQIVKPSQYFLISKYFIDYWLHKLGPKTAWIYISLQQAWWREQYKGAETKTEQTVYCQISQAVIAKELGLERHAIARGINNNPWRSWIIPQVEKQWGWKIGENEYHRPATKYTLNLTMPLVPEHLKGLYVYFKEAGNSVKALKAAINKLLGYKSRDVLEILEKLAPQTEQEFKQAHSIGEVVEISTGLKLSELGLKKAKELDMLYYKLHSHLTELGGVMCRQYFRTQWVPILKPSLAWLVIILKSRCYYNPKTKEMRNSYKWKKKDLAKTLGQSTQNIKLLLNKPYASAFIKLIEDEEDKQSWSVTVQVLMEREPLTPESQRDYEALLARSEGIKPLVDNQEENEPAAKPTEQATEETIQNKAAAEWQTVLAQLQLQMTGATFKTWLSNSQGILHTGPIFVVEVKNQYAKDWLENRLSSMINRTASNVLGQTVEISFIIKNLVDD